MALRSILPNLLSISRVPLGGLIIISYSSESIASYVTALSMILVALVTDMLDGYVARRLDVESSDGYLLDGLGDRSVYIALILTFYSEGKVLDIIAWLLILREITVYAIRVVEVEWQLKLHATRMLSLTHALFIRVWLAILIVEDGLRFAGAHVLDSTWSTVIRGTLLAGTLVAGYSSIYATFAASVRASR